MCGCFLADGAGPGGGGRSGGGSASGPVTACLGGNESRRGGETSWAGWLSSGAVAGWGAQKRIWPGPLGGRAASPAERPPLLLLLCPYKREFVLGNPRCPVKRGGNPIISSQKPPGNDFPGGALYSHGRPLGGGKDTRTHYGSILLARHSRERPPVVCGVSGMSAGESTGHSQSAIAPITPDGGPLRKNWHGPNRAIRAFGTGTSLCISSRGLCNAISGSSAPALHLGEERGRGTVLAHLPSGNPERDSRTRGGTQTQSARSGLRGRLPLAAATHRLGPVASSFCGCVFTPARSHEPCTAPHRNAPRGGGAQPSLSPSRNVVWEEICKFF